MKNKPLFLLAFVLYAVVPGVNAQTGQPPAETAILFAKMFPKATMVDWKEKTNNFTAFFDLDNRKCEAKRRNAISSRHIQKRSGQENTLL